ncbi:MAG: membrane or secreted protein [Owenweeksia sp.]|nr:membrane or secreted protein [Owenweeksia sp.]
MEVFILAVVLIALGFAGIAIKIWAKKDGEFSGTCASNSPFLNKEGEACGFCGAQPQEKCQNEEVKPATS